ncbi:TQO small subunit DoxD [Acidianus manzaensis]|uniref:TQO small subunit DoxD n=1 Tax=Acidianus manzaensis TaxID=282676 RepID=A0A1W6K2Y9_9CREN|nr:TQO small subunit DoxD [Acidianus manzaensis]ARM76860.1 TQO small subunit DoxD [Acidianus manzaensis]
MSKIEQNQMWITLVRLVTASIWLNAGIFDKLLNPGFLNPNSNSYVGFTILYFSEGSIIKSFLYAVAFPHPILTGELVMIGEITFGTLMFLGLGTRLASTAAFYTNLIYFLSAAWTGAEEYGINLLMMCIDAYFIYYGASYFSLDSLIEKKFRLINSKKLWITIASIIYLTVILYLYFYGL